MKIITTQITKPPKIVIHGAAGLGKSSFAKSCPRPLFIQTEDRLGHLGVQATELARCTADVINALDWLIDNDHDYKTVVLDTAGAFEKLSHAEICAEYGAQDINDKKKLGFGLGSRLAESKWSRDVLPRLTILNDKKGILPVIVCHSKIDYKTDIETGEDYQRYVIDLQDKSAKEIKKWADIIIFLDERVSIITNKRDGVEYTTRKGTGQRVLRLKPQPFFEGKESYNMPDNIEWSESQNAWDLISRAIKQGLKDRDKAENLKDVKEDRAIKQLEEMSKNG